MQHLEVQGIPLKISGDQIMRVGYLSFLTKDSVMSIKLPTNVENYRLAHLLQPNYLLDIELVKTKKNWILKSIQKYQNICKLESYKDYTNHAEMIKLVKKFTQEELEYGCDKALMYKKIHSKFIEQTIKAKRELLISDDQIIRTASTHLRGEGLLQ